MKGFVKTIVKGWGLPRVELEGLAERLGIKFSHPEKGIYITERFDKRFYQLAYVRYVGVLRFTYRKPSEIPEKIRELKKYIISNQPFAVVGNDKRTVGWWLDGRVDLKNFKSLVFAYRVKKGYVVSPVKEIKGKDFHVRDAKNRPFFHPSSLNSRDARMLVNAAGVMKGDVVVDPFCGAGGILIEAGLLGAKVIGVDIDKKMVRGCRINLNHYRVKGTVIEGDARTFEPDDDVYAVITDPPYGRSTRTPDKIKSLYLSSFEQIRTYTKKLVTLLPFEGEYILEKAGFEVVRKGWWDVHSSLRRRVYVCR